MILKLEPSTAVNGFNGTSTMRVHCVGPNSREYIQTKSHRIKANYDSCIMEESAYEWAS